MVGELFGGGLTFRYADPLRVRVSVRTVGQLASLALDSWTGWGCDLIRALSCNMSRHCCGR